MRYCVLVAMLFTAQAFAQTYELDLADCQKQAQNVRIDHPGKIMEAQQEAVVVCMQQRGQGIGLPEPQRRQLTLYKNTQALCRESAGVRSDGDMKLFSELYAACLRGHGYLP